MKIDVHRKIKKFENEKIGIKAIQLTLGYYHHTKDKRGS